MIEEKEDAGQEICPEALNQRVDKGEVQTLTTINAVNTFKSFDADFEEYKKNHPEFFPEGTPLEKQKGFFENIQKLRLETALNKQEIFHKLDDAVEDAEWKRDAIKIYQSGGFLPYCINTFSKIWVSDTHILRAILYQAAQFRINNVKEGIHIHVTGQTQSGKSDSVKTSLKFLSPHDYTTRTFSPKWIFHAGQDIHKDMILFSDDTILDPEIAGLYRNILTNWDEGVERGTVINNKSATLTIPPHISLILTSINNVVEESVEGQDESRFLTLEVRRTREQNEEIRKFIQQEPFDIEENLKIIKHIWSIIPTSKVLIHKPVVVTCTIREFKRYRALLQCNALLNGRTTTIDQDFIDIDQFLTYSKPMIDSQTPAHKRDEDAIMSILNGQWKTVGDIMSETKLPYARVLRAIRGIKGTFENPTGGLLESTRNLKMDYNAETRKYSFSLSFI